MDKSANNIIPADEMNQNKEDSVNSVNTPLQNGNSNIQYGGLNDDVEPLLYEESNSRCSRCLRYLTTLTIEPAMFFYMLGFTINMSCLTNLMMDKGCRYYYNYSQEICQNLSAHPEEKTNVEILANNYGMYSNIMSLIGAFSMVFIAPWSDKYGRKIPLILACLGTVVSNVGTLMWALFIESSLDYVVLIKLPSEIVGGFICFLTIMYSHASESTTEKGRTLKFLTIEIAFYMAMSFGGFIGGKIFQYYDYFYVYLTALVFTCLSVLWVVFVVEETIEVEQSVTWNERKRNFFRMDSVAKSWNATVRPRENSHRKMIWLYFLSMCIVILTYEVFGGLGYTYAHHIYNWNPTQYNSVNMIFSLCTFGVMSIATPLFFRRLKLSDSMLGVFGTASMMAKNFLIAFAKYNHFVYYLGNAAGSLSSFTTLAIRTGLSKVTSKEEIGLVFSFLATCEAVFPMVGSTLTTKVFNATIDIHPSVTYLMSVGFLFIPLATFIWIYLRTRGDVRLIEDVNV